MVPARIFVMGDRFTLESLKNYVLLDWIRFLNSREVVSLCCTSRGIKEVLDTNYSVWEHCLSVQPLFVKSNRMILPRIQRNRHCCVWHLYLWHKIESTSSFTYLLCNMDSYLFSSGLVRATFRRIEDLSADESRRYGAHKLLLHEMISKHLLSTEMDDVEEVISGLGAIKVLSRPFLNNDVRVDIFSATIPSLTAQCVFKAILVYQNDMRVLEAAFNACTNLSLYRNNALYFVAEGFINIFKNFLQSGSIINSSAVLLAGLNSLRNIYDPLHLSSEDLEVQRQLMSVIIFHICPPSRDNSCL